MVVKLWTTLGILICRLELTHFELPISNKEENTWVFLPVCPDVSHHILEAISKHQKVESDFITINVFMSFTFLVITDKLVLVSIVCPCCIFFPFALFVPSTFN